MLSNPGPAVWVAFFLLPIYFYNMIDTTVYLEDVKQTAQEMARIVKEYWRDLGAWLDVPLIGFYSFVCSLPYVPDPIGVETVSRPAYTLKPDYRPRDCDDKSVLIAAWLEGNGIKKRFVSTSCRPDKRLTHVFVQMENGIYLDSTYPKYKNFCGNYPYFPRVTKIEPLTGLF